MYAMIDPFLLEIYYLYPMLVLKGGRGVVADVDDRVIKFTLTSEHGHEDFGWRRRVTM